MGRNDDYIKRLKKRLLRLQTGSEYEPIPEEIATMIRVRVRQGYGVSKSKETKEKFKDLETSTINARKRKKKKGLLLSGESPSKSNLTETGEMTDSITGQSKSTSIEIYLDGTRNKKLASYHEVKSRPFFHLTGLEYNKVIRLIRARIKEIIREI
jgi:hypothetical protein